MISNFDFIKPLLEEIDALLDEKVTLYAIGGIVLMYRGLKPATKDIDLVVKDAKEYEQLRKLLVKIKFIPTKPEFGYDRFNLSQILIRHDFRIDLFSKTVCKCFSLSSGMMQRAQEVISLKKLKFCLCSNEDLFVFKTITEREGDLQDCIALSGRGLNWQVILDELREQTKTTGTKVWITWVGERLDLLVEKGLNIPIMKDIDVLREAYYNELEAKKK